MLLLSHLLSLGKLLKVEIGILLSPPTSYLTPGETVSFCHRFSICKLALSYLFHLVVERIKDNEIIGITHLGPCLVYSKQSILVLLSSPFLFPFMFYFSLKCSCYFSLHLVLMSIELHSSALLVCLSHWTAPAGTRTLGLSDTSFFLFPLALPPSGSQRDFF